jgi:hypothetical protein
MLGCPLLGNCPMYTPPVFQAVQMYLGVIVVQKYAHATLNKSGGPNRVVRVLTSTEAQSACT